jgi:hypothetical protein
MDPQTFDRLVRGFSHSASRRRALGGLLGGALATVAGASMSEANRRHRRRQGQAKDQGGNSDCAHFCQRVFPPGPDRGRCISDAAHHQGACADCAGDTSRICCTPSVAGAMCDSSQPIACCASGQTCQDRTCVATCTPTTCAAQGKNCGAIADGCGNTLNCGSCTAPNTCTNNVCGCTPTTCAQLGLHCGMADDGCGGTLQCGGCGPCRACRTVADNTACGRGNICCHGVCKAGVIDPLNCGACGHNCFDEGGCDCLGSVCCQCQNGASAGCSTSLPCCGHSTCRTGGQYAGTCCAPSGFGVPCSTDDPSVCCGTCVLNDPNCTEHCSGHCA